MTKNIVRLTVLLWLTASLPARAAEYFITALSPSTLGGKTLWVDATDKAGTAAYPAVGTSYQVLLTATGSTNGTFTIPAAPGMPARSGTWSAGLPNGMPQAGGNYLFINFVGLLGDAVTDNLTFYPAFGAANQIPCNYYLFRGDTGFGSNATDNQRGYVRATDGEAPTPFAPSFQFVNGGYNYFSGSSPTLTATVIGSFPLSYQWLKDSAPIPDATNATLTLTAIKITDAGTYTIVASNSAGSISSNLTVTVTPSTPPVITTQPTNQTVLSNTTVQITVAATGTAPLFYQWRKDGADLTTNAVTFGITNAQLTIYNFSGTNTGDYSVVITNYAGAVTSAVATINILQVTTPTFTTQPPPVISILTNGTFTINTAVAGTPTPTLRWQKNSVNIPGATNATLNVRDTNYNASGTYRLIAANLNGSATSSVAVVNVYDRNLYYNNPAPTNAVLPQGGNLRQRASTYGLPPVYFTLRKDGTNVPGFISLPENVFPEIYDSYYDLTLTNLQPSDSGAYSFVVSNTVGGMATSAVFNVTIQSTNAPVVLQPPTNVNTYLFTSGTIINERVAYSSFYPVTVQWLSNNIVLSGQTTSNLTLGFTSVQDFNLAAILSNQSGSTTSTVAHVSITYGPGTRDTNFVSANAISGGVTTLAALPNGGVLVGGTFTSWGTSNRNYLVELATNGTVTPWLAHTNGINGLVYKIQRLGDGKILVAGQFNNVGSPLHYGGLLRLNADGTLDQTFQAGSPDANRYIDYNVTTFTVRPSDGAIAIAGTFTNVAGQLQRALALLDSNGVFQASFRPSLSNSIYQTYPFGIASLAFQGDGKLLVGGNFGMVGSVGRTNIARLNTDGTLDTGFNVLPVGSGVGVSSLIVQPDGGICLAGSFFSVAAPSGSTFQTRNYFARVRADGTLDPVTLPPVNLGGVLARQSNGNILYAGTGFQRLFTNDTVDAFWPGNGFGTPSGGQVTAMDFGPDGSLWIGGTFSTVGGNTQWRVAHLTMEPMLLAPPSLGQIIFSTGSFSFRLPTAAQRNYRVEFKNALTDPTWQTQQSFTGDGQDRNVTVTLPGATPRAFFRIAAD